MRTTGSDSPDGARLARAGRRELEGGLCRPQEQGALFQQAKPVLVEARVQGDEAPEDHVVGLARHEGCGAGGGELARKGRGPGHVRGGASQREKLMILRMKVLMQNPEECFAEHGNRGSNGGRPQERGTTLQAIGDKHASGNLEPQHELQPRCANAVSREHQDAAWTA